MNINKHAGRQNLLAKNAQRLLLHMLNDAL